MALNKKEALPIQVHPLNANIVSCSQTVLSLNNPNPDSRKLGVTVPEQFQACAQISHQKQSSG